MQLKVFSLKFLLLMIVSFSTIASSLYSEEPEKEKGYEPIYCGSLLAFYPQNIPPGHLSVQPYLVFNSTYGSYKDNWSFQSKKNIYDVDLFTFLEAGITENIDISLAFDEKYSQFRGNRTIQYGNTHAWLGFQLLRDQKGTSIPDLRILVGESFPTGKYKDLNPKYGGGDSNGSGSYQTSLIFVMQKIFYKNPMHPFNINLNLFAIFPSETSVSGFNAYGGGYGTKGRVKPGNIYIVNFAYEYSFTKYWEWSVDLRYRYQAKSPFYGERGVTEDGTAADNGLAASQIFSLAPAIGYNFNKKLCITWGAWFSVAGKNRDAFFAPSWTVFYMF